MKCLLEFDASLIIGFQKILNTIFCLPLQAASNWMQTDFEETVFDEFLIKNSHFKRYIFFQCSIKLK